MEKNKKVVVLLHGMGCAKHDNCFTCGLHDCDCSDSHNKVSKKYVDVNEIIIDNKPVYDRS